MKFISTSEHNNIIEGDIVDISKSNNKIMESVIDIENLLENSHGIAWDQIVITNELPYSESGNTFAKGSVAVSVTGKKIGYSEILSEIKRVKEKPSAKMMKTLFLRSKDMNAEDLSFVLGLIDQWSEE